MLISPPFLPDRLAGQTDEQWLDAAMPGAEDGHFPVSAQLGWHGGRHLVAPLDAQGAPLPVRAVADGRVLFVRQRTEADDRNHPLWYDQGYTSDAVVVVEHHTELGANADNLPVALRYYSVYLHLNTIENTVRVGQAIRRKDPVGSPGHIAGAPGRIHFEIALNPQNLQSLVGRATGDLPLDRDGRTEVIYGEVYVRLPANTPVYAAQPPLGSAQVPATLAELTRSDADWFVGLLHGQGDVRISTYLASGERVGAVYTEANQGEYRLFARAQALSTAVQQANLAAHQAQAPVPSPSACLELLRLGRVIGPDALTPATTPHWRQINTPAGLGWVNLNAQGTTKYSDADFPHWRGWRLIDDSQDGDSRCDLALIRGLINPTPGARVSAAEAQTRLQSEAVRARLDKTLCRFPSEWDSATLEHRWGWLRQASEEFPEPLSDEDWPPFLAYAQALCFACAPLFEAQWCVEPKTFIGHLRQCGWRSAREVSQMMPSHAIRGTAWEVVNPAPIDGETVLGRHRVPLNKALRKYGIDTPWRQVAFFGNAIQETGWLVRLSEFGAGTLWYRPWSGRGFLQLTGPGNYCEYWVWRGRSIPAGLSQAMVTAYNTMYNAPARRTEALLADANFPALTAQMRAWRQDVAAGNGDNDQLTIEERTAPSDSAAYYWAKNDMARHADEAHVVERRTVATGQGQKVYYRSPAFWRASAAVNLPGAIPRTDYRGINGFDSRCSAYGVLIAVLTERRLPDAQGQATVWYPEGYTRRAVL